MKAPCGSCQLWAEKLKQSKTYAHLGPREEEKEKAGRVEEEGEKCTAQDPAGSDLDHLANAQINMLSLPRSHADIQPHERSALSHFSAAWLNSNNASSISFIIRCALTSSFSYLLSVRGTRISPICEGVDPVFPPYMAWSPPPLSETVKDRDRALIQQHVWCIFKQRRTFSSFQPTGALILYNLISGWNHTAYLSNIKYLQFSLSGHLTENGGKKKILFDFLCISPHLQPFHLAPKRGRDLSSYYHLFFWKRERSSAVRRVVPVLARGLEKL